MLSGAVSFLAVSSAFAFPPPMVTPLYTYFTCKSRKMPHIICTKSYRFRVCTQKSAECTPLRAIVSLYQKLRLDRRRDGDRQDLRLSGGRNKNGVTVYGQFCKQYFPSYVTKYHDDYTKEGYMDSFAAQAFINGDVYDSVPYLEHLEHMSLLWYDIRCRAICFPS